ncbi:MAG: protease modulator HflC [Rhodobiaceae bacterium]|nr:protease modulator HflC [Rhodobiaceae bacterium]
MKQGLFGLSLIILAALAFVAYNALFSIHQTQQALVLQFGEAKRVISDPGLHVKIPFVQNVIYIDKRILALDTPSQEVIASDQKRLEVNAFMRYRIVDPLVFYQAVGTIPVANTRLQTVLNSAVRRVLGDASFEAVVRDDRPVLMARISEQANREAKSFGIQIVDVRIKRADLPEQNSQAIYQRMQTERQQEAAEIRARGEEINRRIRSRAERDKTVLLAEAERDSQRIRGEGDGERNRVFNEAFGKDPEFFSFYRSMQAYEKALNGSKTQMVISPDSDLFRYFVDPSGKMPAPAAPAAPQPQQ